jgi:hypothetical protein
MALRIVNNIAWWVIAVWFAGFATLRPRSGQALDSPITVGDLVAFLVVFGLLAGLGRWTARIAHRKGRNYVGWSYYGLCLPYIALPHAFLLKSNAPATADAEAWDELNRAISDRSLYSARLRDLRRYHRAAIDRGVSVPPSLVDNIQRLVSQKESRRQLMWTMVAAAAAIAAVIISLVGLLR